MLRKKVKLDRQEWTRENKEGLEVNWINSGEWKKDDYEFFRKKIGEF